MLPKAMTIPDMVNLLNMNWGNVMPSLIQKPDSVAFLKETAPAPSRNGFSA